MTLSLYTKSVYESLLQRNPLTQHNIYLLYLQYYGNALVYDTSIIIRKKVIVLLFTRLHNYICKHTNNLFQIKNIIELNQHLGIFSPLLRNKA